MTLAAADPAAEPGEFRSRLIAGAKDVQQLVTSEELPTWDDFTARPATSDWPPLNLGILPVLGGAFREDPKDWEPVLGAGAVTGFVACAAFLASGDTTKMWLCVAGVIVVVLVAAAIAAA
jgi:hypothetical protein